jgi:hypothetical protein
MKQLPKKTLPLSLISALTQYFIPFGILFFQYYFGLQKKDNLLITVENKSSISIKSFIVHNRLALIAIPFYFNHFNNVPVNAIIHDDSLY